MRKIKLLWEFRGPDAVNLARHHAKHLSEFIQKEKYVINIVEHEVISDAYAIAFIVVLEQDLVKFRDTLRPHRAIVYQNS